MKTTSPKLASALLVALANLGCFCSPTFALELAQLIPFQADLSLPSRTAPSPTAPVKSPSQNAQIETAPPRATPQSAPQSTVQSAPQTAPSPKASTKNDAPVQYKASILYGMLERINYEGWEPAELRQYQIADGRLIATDPVQIEPSENANLTAPLSSSEVVPLQEFRCRVIVQKRFKRGNRYITIRAFQFENYMGANAGYDLLRKGSTAVVKLGDGSSDDGDSISFWQSNFLFIISGSSLDDDESKGVIGVFAKKLSSSVSVHKLPPPIISKLPIVDRVRGTEKIVMGPVSAARVIPTASIDSLMIEKAVGAVVADYQVFIPARERLRLLYIDYGDAQLAQSAYNAFMNKQDELHLPEKGWPQDGRVLYRAGKTFVFCQIKPSGKLLLITGARKGKSPILLAQQVVER